MSAIREEPRFALTASKPRPAAPRIGVLRRHWLIALVVLAGLVIRLLTMVAFSPALFFPDSWGYIASAYQGAFVGLPSLHPIGYPILIRLLTLPDRSPLELVAFQHLAGLAVGVAIYVTLSRLRLPRWAAAGAAALVLLDGYSITLEQYVMSDTFFTAAMLAAVLVLAWPRLSAASPPVSAREWLIRGLGAGVLLAVATLIREVAPLAIPVFVAYLAWMRVGARPLVAFLVAAVLPLVAYSALVDHRYHVFGLTATSGWTLYGRVGGFADCDGVKLEPAARGLCETAAQRASHPDAPDWYIWEDSPAQRIFHPATQSLSAVARTNHVLASFSRTIILHQPLAFADATLSDFLRYFTPGAAAYSDALSATSLPESTRDEAHDSAVRHRDLRGLRLHVRSPAGLVRAYRNLIHVPGALLGVLAILALLGIALRIAARREVLLLVGSALMLLLGTAATGGFSLRYLLPAVPLLAIGGPLAAAQLTDRLKERRS